MLFSRSVWLCFVPCLLMSCSSGGNSVAVEDIAPTDVVSNDVAAEDDQISVAPLPDVAADPLYAVWYDGFSLPDSQPAIYLVPNKVNGPNLVTFFVKAKGLGKLAGAAFYLAYDSEFLRYDNGLNHLNFGDSGPYFTADAVKELEPGRLTFGAARFCKDKIPWGSTDQCGGIDIDEETTVAAFTFELIGKGQGSLRFPAANTLLLRPDRSSVEAAWIGGSFIVEEQEVAP